MPQTLNIFGKVLKLNFVALREDRGRSERVLKLSNVARPGVGSKSQKCALR